MLLYNLLGRRLFGLVLEQIALAVKLMEGNLQLLL